MDKGLDCLVKSLCMSDGYTRLGKYIQTSAGGDGSNTKRNLIVDLNYKIS